MSATSTANGGVSGPVGVVTPPHNLEAEQSVLGAILLSDRSLYALVIEEGLRPEDFYRGHHGAIYEAMLALYQENEPVDVLTVTDRLRQMGKLGDIGGQALERGAPAQVVDLGRTAALQDLQHPSPVSGGGAAHRIAARGAEPSPRAQGGAASGTG